jgi:hypothetical protein
MPPVDTAQRGMTPNEVGRLRRISPDRVRAMIIRGELGAINTAPAHCGRPRYIVLPHHLDAWDRRHQAVTPARPTPRRRRQNGQVDYYPDQPGGGAA